MPTFALPTFALPVAVAVGSLVLGAMAAPHTVVARGPRYADALQAQGPVDGGGRPDLTMPGNDLLGARDATAGPVGPALPVGAPGDVVTGDPSGGRGPVRAVPAVSFSGSPTTIPGPVLAAYRAAAATVAGDDPGCRLTWPVLAGIGKVESGHARGGVLDAGGRTLAPILGPLLDGSPGVAAIPDTDGGRWDGDSVWDRAVGPMQFIPSSWRVHAADGNRDGVSDPSNVFDATLAAARYLCTGDRDLSVAGDLRQAVFGYNHSSAYVATVLAWASVYATGQVLTTASTAGSRARTGSPQRGPRSGAGGSGTAGGGTTGARPTPGGARGRAPASTTVSAAGAPASGAPASGAAAGGDSASAAGQPPSSGAAGSSAPRASEPAPTDTPTGQPRATATGTPTPTPTPTPTCPLPTGLPVVPAPTVSPGVTAPASPPDPGTPLDPCATATPTPTATDLPMPVPTPLP
ncbi:MAG: hypothetical protein QOI54_3130 [Actinomycetota bacterium]|nr:hypothetical protein [Actinomycetota bacterium]